MNPSRKETVAGTFYSGDPDELKKDIESFLHENTSESKNPIKFIIVPHAGYMYSGGTAACSFVEAQKGNYRRIVLIGPSHRFYFQGLLESGASSWCSPLGDLNVESISTYGVEANFAYHKPEHSLEVQIPFLRHLFPNARIIPMIVSGGREQAEDLANLLAPVDDPETLWVISSDFNHYGPQFGYTPKIPGFHSGEELDRKAIELIADGDISGFTQFLKSTDATICGALPILISMYLAKKWKLPNYQFKKYSCSGDITGDRNSVGYASLFA